ncbi:MAG: metallophosphoesterase [Lachnospiraceae bacterium]|jgi:predicted MPP superfamily phosphohydrolase|nr:metallophosphoesterase [Lachnospiraceae bacterium]
MKKNFITLCLITLYASLITGCETPKEPAVTDGLNIKTEEIIIAGLEGEYRFLFFSDLHMALAGEGDSPEIRDYVAERSAAFDGASSLTAPAKLAALVEAANAQTLDAVLMGGDIIDCPTPAALASLSQNLKLLDAPYLFALGNHDYTFPWEYFSEKSLTEYLPELATSVDVAADGFSILELDGLVVVALDDSTNQINPAALSRLEAVLAQQKPVIILMHVPLVTDGNADLLAKSLEVWGPDPEGNSRVLLGFSGLWPNEGSRRFMDMIFAKDSPVVAILAGHAHFPHRDVLEPGIVQIIAAPAYEGNATIIEIKGQ